MELQKRKYSAIPTAWGTGSGRGTPVSSTGAKMISPVFTPLTLDEDVAMKVIDMKMIKG